MRYLGEFRSNWSNLLGTCFGLSTGASLSFYTLSLFGPALIGELGWSKAGFALVGSLHLLTLPLLPFIGRFTDRVGPRIAGSVGFATVIVCFLAFAMMRGSLWEFLAIQALLSTFGVMTSSMVLGRVVVDRFDRARGLALSIMMSASPISGALAAPLLAGVITDHGWRAGYLALALVAAIGGTLTILLIGRVGQDPSGVPKVQKKLSRAEFMGIVRNPVFPLLIGGMFLVNVPQVFATSQLKLVALENGVSDSLATWMVSLFAMGVIGGRWMCGLALDRIKPHLVAFVTLGLPTISYLIFASHIPATGLLVVAVLLIGLAQGAEGDVGAFIISRRFDARNFSLLFSFLNMMVGSGSAIGSLILSLTLQQGHSYFPFIIVCAVTAFLGAVLFGLTGMVGGTAPEPEEKDRDAAAIQKDLAGEPG
jgi:MFS family permease